MKIVTVEQMRQLEQRADVAGVSYAQMMEAAGRAVADAIVARWSVRDQNMLVLVGPGNNGGDGLVAARHLHDMGAQVTLYLWKRKTEGDFNFAQTQARGIKTLRAEGDENFSQLRAALDGSTISVDALLGTGANRPIEGTLKEILVLVNPQIPNPKSHPPPSIIAVDLPSGLNADTGTLDPATVSADLTVTFAFPKVGFYKFPAADALGEWVIADIGIPPEFADSIALNLATQIEIAKLLPTRPRTGHKGTFGKAMIVAGSSYYTGAPYLSAAAAARVGTGLVTLATTSEVQHIVAASLHEATFVPLPDAAGAIASNATRVLLDGLKDYDALLIGPGLGRARGTQQFIYRLLDAHEQSPAFARTVIDADALNILSEQREWWRTLPPNCVLTPHVGEFARLSGLDSKAITDNRETCAREHSQQWNQIVLFKGAFTLIAEPSGQVTLLPFANPALATAGSGDVLSGILVGLMAQGLSPRDAAIVGGYLHGSAGELARDDIGDAGVIASDLLPRIPRALRAIKQMG